jgi:hypothetical protein
VLKAGLKTKAARRVVDVSSDVASLLNEFIQGKSGLLFPLRKGLLIWLAIFGLVGCKSVSQSTGFTLSGDTE